MRELKCEIEKYLQSTPKRFHTPLHKGKEAAILEITAKYDVTEVGEFDNLLHQTGVLKRLTEKCEGVFGAKKCFLSTQGTSLANLVMMYALKDFGKVAVLRSCHKSIYSAIDIFKMDVMFINDFEAWQSGEAISEEKIREAFDAGAKSVVLTCPSYYGDMPSLEKIRAVADEYGGIVAVDEAHGTQNYFMDGEIQKASSYADIFSGSFHKALPAFTGAAVLCVVNKKLIAGCERGYDLLHSTSPNYMSLLSIEYCVDSAADFKEKYCKWRKLRKWLSENLRASGICEIAKGDITKLVLKFPGAMAVADMLEKDGIYAEFSDMNRIVFLLNFLDEKEEYEYLLQTLKSAVIMQNLRSQVMEEFNLVSGEEENAIEDHPLLKKHGENIAFVDGEVENIKLAVKSITNSVISPKKMMEYCSVQVENTEKIKLENAVGRIAACNFGIYPPCFFLVVKGEEIPQSIVDLHKRGVDLFGVENGEVAVVL